MLKKYSQYLTLPNLLEYLETEPLVQLFVVKTLDIIVSRIYNV